MKSGKRIDGKQKPVTGRTKPGAGLSTSDSRTTPRTYELLLVDSDNLDETGKIRLTSREVFESICPGESPDVYEKMKEEEIRSRMLDRAERLAVFEEKWHPDDVPTLARACTDYIIEFREMKKLDTAQFNKVKMPATPAPRKR